MSGNREARPLERSWLLSTVAVGALALLWLVSTQLRGVRAHSPWSDDPYDAALSVASLVLPFVWGVTTARLLRWRAEPALPPHAARTIVRGFLVVLILVWAPVLGGLAALAAHARHQAWGPWLVWLEALVAVTGVAALIASVDVARLYLRWRKLGPAQPSGAEPDALDDISALLERTGRSVANGFPGLARLLDGCGAAVAGLASSRLGPRRHRIAWCLALAAGFGASLAAWHGIAEGPPGHWYVDAVLTTAGAAVVVLSYACLGTYLRLIRPERPREPRTA